MQEEGESFPGRPHGDLDRTWTGPPDSLLPTPLPGKEGASLNVKHIHSCCSLEQNNIFSAFRLCYFCDRERKWRGLYVSTSWNRLNFSPKNIACILSLVCSLIHYSPLVWYYMCINMHTHTDLCNAYNHHLKSHTLAL